MANAMDDPSVLWDAYCARQDAIRKAELEEGTCSTCKNYYPAPDEWTVVDCGWCVEVGDFVEGDWPAEDCEDSYEPCGY